MGRDPQVGKQCHGVKGASHLEEGAQREPHLDVLDLLQSEVGDLRLLGLACRGEVAEQLGEQQSLS